MSPILSQGVGKSAGVLYESYPDLPFYLRELESLQECCMSHTQISHFISGSWKVHRSAV